MNSNNKSDNRVNNNGSNIIDKSLNVKTKRVMKIIDWVALIVAIFVVLGFLYKVTDGNIDPSSVQTGKASVTYKVQVYNEKRMLKQIKVGDQITEGKKQYDLYVKAVDFKPDETKRMIFTDGRITHISDDKVYAVVTISGEIDTKGDAYKLGNREIRTGNVIFLESRLYKFSGIVVEMEK